MDFEELKKQFAEREKLMQEKVRLDIAEKYKKAPEEPAVEETPAAKAKRGRKPKTAKK